MSVDLAGKRVLVIGERDGIPSSALAHCVEAAGGLVAFGITECFV